MRRYKHFQKGILAALLAAVLLGAAFAEEPPGDSKAPAAAASPEETVKPEPFPEWDIRAGVLIACRNPAAVVTVPNGIREIAPHAFQGLRNLEKVNFAVHIVLTHCAPEGHIGKNIRAVYNSDLSRMLAGSMAGVVDRSGNELTDFLDDLITFCINF